MTKPMVALLKRWLGFGIIKCFRMHRLVYDYVQGTLDESTRRRFEEHLRDCPACFDYFRSYREAVILCRRHYRPCLEMPPQVRRKLEEFLESM